MTTYRDVKVPRTFHVPLWLLDEPGGAEHIQAAIDAIVKRAFRKRR